MPATTPGGMPYPLGTDPISDGDDAIKALALAITAPTIATFTFATGWQQQTAAPRLTRVAGRWLLVLNWMNTNAGTFTAGQNTVGNIAAAARSGVGVVRSACWAGGLPTVWSTIADVNTSTGDVTFFVPTTVSVSANQLGYAFAASWDAQAT